MSANLFRSSHLTSRIRRYAYALPFLLITQITLGAYTVLTRKAVDVTTAHVATGALILVACLLAFLHLVRVYQVRLKKFSIDISTERAIA